MPSPLSKIVENESENNTSFKTPPPIQSIERFDAPQVSEANPFMTKYPTTSELQFGIESETILNNLDSIEIKTKKWSDYFKNEEKIIIQGDKFQVYSIPQIKDLDKPLTFLCHHGAGHTALTFGLMAAKLHEKLEGRCKIVAFDCRGHGLTETKESNDLSLDRLSRDLINLAGEVAKAGEIILIGHSMGGAVVTEVAISSKDGKLGILNLAGLVVIDVVEGTALAALGSMNIVLSKRPSRFKSIEEAVKWSIKSQTVKNLEAAQLSIPSQIRPFENSFIWRTDLAKSSPYWKGWFEGLSKKFLGAGAPKLLILAGTDRLDKDLMIGQMQGKFQLEVRPYTSHVVQEDDPEGVAGILATFTERYHRPIPKVFLPKS